MVGFEGKVCEIEKPAAHGPVAPEWNSELAFVLALSVAGTLAEVGCCLACKPHRQALPSPEQRCRLESKVRLADVDIESQASEPYDSQPQSAEWLPTFLHKCKLDQHLATFRDANCEEMEDIQSMGRETMSRMGLNSMEAKRLQRYAAAAAAAATGPIAVHTAACGSATGAPQPRGTMKEQAAAAVSPAAALAAPAAASEAAMHAVVVAVAEAQAEAAHGEAAGAPVSLHEINVKELRSRAAEVGVASDAIEAARDGDDPTGDLTALIEAKV